MRGQWRRSYSQLLTSGSQLLLLVVGMQLEFSHSLFYSLVAIAALSLLAWSSSWRRARLIDDTPTSRILSAAQGYVELIGRGQPLAGLPLLSPLNGLPCLWYRYLIERRNSKNQWVTESRGESEAGFVIDDGSGLCLVDPEGAEMLISRKDRWTQYGRRYTQWLLIRQQTIYTLGEFHTVGSVDPEWTLDAEVKELLASWKRQPAELLRRFDRDGNGQLDLQEWERAREAARQEVLASRRELQQAPEAHAMRQPRDGRLYLISDLSPEVLSRRYRRWALLHLLIFFASLASLPTVWLRGY